MLAKQFCHRLIAILNRPSQGRVAGLRLNGIDPCSAASSLDGFFRVPLDISSTQHYCCVVIPKSVDINGVWNVLPPGIHDATLEEIEERFAINEKRRKLFEGLRKSLAALRLAGCTVVFLDGSFITDK